MIIVYGYSYMRIRGFDQTKINFTPRVRVGSLVITIINKGHTGSSPVLTTEIN